MAAALPALSTLGSYIGPALQWGSVAGSLLGAVGQFTAGSQQADAYKAQARSTEIQGELANLSAREKAAEVQNESNRMRAMQVVQGAAGGMSLDSGSLLDIMADSASKFEKDRQSLLRSGRLSQEASNYSAQGYKQAGSTSYTSGIFGAGSSLLKGAGQAFDIGKSLKWW